MYRKILVGLVFSCFVSVASAAPPVKTFIGVDYVTGGISIEEEAQLAEMAGNYTLKVVNALKCGDYLNNINILIMDEADSIVLETDTNGPILYANLKPGKYTVYASAFGERYQKPFTAKQSIQRQVVFYWPTEPKSCTGK